MRILISGYKGFLGRHLLRAFKSSNRNFDIIPLTKSDFESSSLSSKIKKNDTIFHFAGVNRDLTEKTVYEKNEKINQTLYEELEKLNFTGNLYFTSSTQEESNTPYGIAKKKARIRFLNQSKKLSYNFHGIICPNLFGPFCKPNYNSFIATFCYQIINNVKPDLKENKKISLIYVNDLINKLMSSLSTNDKILIEDVTYEKKTGDILKLLNTFKKVYVDNDSYPNISSYFDQCLFNTFISYLDFENYFPKKYKVHEDNRGSFAELIRTFSMGQTSMSITKKNETRGNHFHTRKIERFSVINGRALVCIRELLSDKIIKFELDGSYPSYVDIPIWHTHNIKNIGDKDLITIFWINEHYEDKTADTYIEIV